MADLSDANSGQTVKITGSASTGVEQTFVQSTSNGGLHVNLRNNAGTEIGISATPVYVQGTIEAVTAPQSNDMFSVGLAINMATASTDNPLILLRNPSGSGKRIMIWQLFVGVNVTNVSALFKVFANPTVTANGTSQTVYSRKIGQALTPVGLVNTLSTVSSAGSQLQAFSLGQNTNAEPMVSEFSIMLEPNNSMLITGSPSSNNREAAVTVTWTEVTL